MKAENSAKLLATAIIVLVWVAMAAAPVPAAVLTPDLRTAMQSAEPDEPIPVIISLKDKVRPKDFKRFKRAVRRTRLIRALRQKADSTQNPIIQMLGQGRSQKLRRLWLVNGIAVATDKATIRKLARQAAIESIRLDIAIPLETTTIDPTSAPEWNLAMTNSDVLWAAGVAGGGVVVAGMDSGVDANHPDLSGRWRGGANSWYDPNEEHLSPYDADGHGTQTMGLMIGGDSDGSVVGMAPDAQWIAVKIFDDNDVAPLSSIHLGFQWLLDPDGNADTDDAPDVVNNSWGFPDTAGTCYQEFAADIDALKTAGIAVVFAAGNSGPAEDTSISPANNAGAFSVGSIGSDFLVATDSSSGPNACDGGIYPNVAAPGVAVKTTDLTFGGINPDPYINVSGTSFAAPHVAGAMALLLSGIPGLTPDQLETALRQSAVDLGAPGADNDYGHGLIDVAAAYEALGGSLSCIDTDGDGFYAADGCGTPVDCNDTDPSIYPGAPEIPDDGIDQNCDNIGSPDTVTLLRAVYLAETQQLRLWATTDDPNAVLACGGMPMTQYFTDPQILNGGYYRLYVDGVASHPGDVTVTSESGGMDTQTPKYIVPPAAVADNFESVSNTDLVVPAEGILSNDLKGGYIWSTEILRAIEVLPPSHGSLNLNPDGAFTYIPETGYVGLDSFTYRVQIENVNTGKLSEPSNDTSVTIDVLPSGGGTTDTVTILRAIYRASSSELRLWATTDDPTAVLSYNGTAFTDYFADPNILNGGYYRLYVAGVTAHPGPVTVTSSAGGSDTQTPKYIADPVAVADSYDAVQDTVLNISAEGVLTNDLKGGYVWSYEQLQALEVTGPSSGTLDLLEDGSFTYTPNPGFTGPDSFTYNMQIVNTNTGAVVSNLSNEVTVAINVAPSGGDTTDTVTILRAIYRASSSELRLWATTDDPAAVLSYNGTVFTDYFADPNILNGGYYRLYVAGVTAHPGPVTVTSSAGGSDTQTPRFILQPVAVADSFNMVQNTDLLISPDGVLTNDHKGGYIWSYEQLQALEVSPPSNGTLVLNTDGSFTYTPNPGFTGTDSFTYNLRIENLNTGAFYGLSNDATVIITVDGPIP